MHVYVLTLTPFLLFPHSSSSFSTSHSSSSPLSLPPSLPSPPPCSSSPSPLPFLLPPPLPPYLHSPFLPSSSAPSFLLRPLLLLPPLPLPLSPYLLLVLPSSSVPLLPSLPPPPSPLHSPFFLPLLDIQKLFLEAGGLLWDECPVTEIIPGEVVTLITRKGHVMGKKVVVTVGPWAKDFMKTLNVELPLQVYC